jgi:hypothetical protein
MTTAASDFDARREALFRKMFDAVTDVLVPNDVVMEDMFKDVPPHMARMAIASLAAELLCYAVDDFNTAFALQRQGRNVVSLVGKAKGDLPLRFGGRFWQSIGGGHHRDAIDTSRAVTGYRSGVTLSRIKK